MKFIALKVVFSLFLGIMSNTSIGATLFNRADFGANAVEYGFDNTNLGDQTPGDGNFQADGGIVRGSPAINFSNSGFTAPLAYAGLRNQLDFTFDEPVSAFGFNFAFSNQDRQRFFIADSNDSNIGFIDLDPNDFGICESISFFVCGFIGLNVDANLISSAGFLKLGSSIFGALIDNVIYETVPTPGISWLIAPGFLGLFWSRKRSFS